MTQSAILRSIISRFATGWGNNTPVEYPNVAFTPPNQTPWVRVTVMPGEEVLASLGSPGARVFRSYGVIDVAVFVPIGTSAETASGLVDSIATIFRGATFDGITCRAPSVALQGISEGWYQTNVSVPYQRDDIL